VREGSDPGPPAARVDLIREVRFGTTLEDPYRRMEREDEEFHRWLESQARHARLVLDAMPRRDALLARIRSLGGTVPQIWRCGRRASGSSSSGASRTHGCPC
jgi:hypothetical protein